MTEQPSVETARNLGLERAVNARDLGGYLTQDGRRVRSGVALRSDALNRLSERDLEVLAGSGLRRVIDLRSMEEVREAGPDVIPGLPVAEVRSAEFSADSVTVEPEGPDGITLHHVPVYATDFDIYVSLRDALAGRDAERQREVLGDGKAARMMEGLYRWFVTSPLGRERFAEVLRLVAAPDGPPVLFHCSAGKDRTGWAAALILTALGVDRETVFTDYLLTNERSGAIIKTIVESFRSQGLMKDPSLMLPIFHAERPYLEAAFEELENGWGTFEKFWQEGLGLDDTVLAGLRHNLLD
ncbi:tyrosine-protein phosphatase [Kitasatospora sp. NPDC002227]|uniref:tyrosine-protein phosphatase n=1 Tax=Kitasatospora sp. NPDC002227 TaxID=3154773 RepID=UPI00332E33D9